ncbi:type III secretion system cytoplasmic ring protein SctQ [Propionivibrio soli]|uniref:type III secretion system cytoplasmic ring protein SctQ n=1 Tax=Propionivibrio soli TaxID=2976531 RepID=UPI0021E98669|nr:type III secretion system cytoplasmic ring protein SctQ [Propionivibrio soli]
MDANHTAVRPHKPFRRFTGNEAQARTLLAQRAVELSVPLGGEEWLLSLVPVLERPGDIAGEWRVDAQWAGAPVLITLPGNTAIAWVEARFPELDLPGLPSPFAAAALQEALTDAVQAIVALGRGPAQVDRLDASPASGTASPGHPPVHHFLLTLHRNGQAIHGALSTDSLGLMLMAGAVATLPPVVNAIDEDALPIRLRAEIGRTALSAEALSGLRGGDTVLIDDCWISQGGELWLGQDQFGVRARCEDTQLAITQAFTEIPLAMAANESETRGDAAPAPLASIPVRVTFDLGERTLSLGELKTLQPGQTLDLGRPLGSAVSIRANGALIGHGELVEVDGRLGVTIASLAESGS